MGLCYLTALVRLSYLTPLEGWYGPETSLRYPITHHLKSLVYKITYAPMIYTSLNMIFDACRTDSLLRQVGGGWALEISNLLGRKWHSPISSMPFHWAQKTLDFQGPTHSHMPSQWICMHQKYYAQAI